MCDFQLLEHVKDSSSCVSDERTRTIAIRGTMAYQAAEERRKALTEVKMT